MTEHEFHGLMLSMTNYRFTLDYGAIAIGRLLKEGNKWYIIGTGAVYSEQKIAVEPGHVVRADKLANFSSHNSNFDFSFDGSVRYKTLVIFGAGASFDYCYQDNKKQKPPLCKDLFCNDNLSLLAEHPGAEDLSSQLQQANDLEDYFQRQWEKVITHHNPQLQSKLIDVQFYLHRLFRGVSAQPNFSHNNYSAFFQFLNDHLLSKGSREKAMIVSFNYDTILEKTLTRLLQLPFDNLDDYIDFNSQFLLFKPHGSWNWVRTIEPEACSALVQKEGIVMTKLHADLYAKKISLGQMMSCLSEGISILPDVSQWDYYYFPQLLIPYKTKDDFIMPNTHTVRMRHFLTQVEKIIIVGWKGAEEKFKTMLHETLSSKPIAVSYVNNGDDTIEKELAPILPYATFTEIAPHVDSIPTFTGLNKELHNFEDLFS